MSEIPFEPGEHIEAALHAEPGIDGELRWRWARYIAAPDGTGASHLVQVLCSDSVWRKVNLPSAQLRKVAPFEVGALVEAQLHEGGMWIEVMVIARAREIYRVRWAGHAVADWWEGDSDWEVPGRRVRPCYEVRRARAAVAVAVPPSEAWRRCTRCGAAAFGFHLCKAATPVDVGSPPEDPLLLTQQDLHCFLSMTIALGEQVTAGAGSAADRRLLEACMKIVAAYRYRETP